MTTTPDPLEEITAVQEKYVEELMEKANVIGIGVGMAIVKDEPTEQMALVVMVSKKLPLAQLAHADVVPARLDGVRVDVQETGVFTAST